MADVIRTEEEWNKLTTLLTATFTDGYRREYELTGNLGYVFMAYNTARVGSKPLPEWVLEFLDGWAKILTDNNCPTNKNKIADALGLGTKTGRLPDFSKMRRDRRIVDAISAWMTVKYRSLALLENESEIPFIHGLDRHSYDNEAARQAAYQQAIERVREASQFTLEKAYERAAKMHGIEPETVGKIWSKYRKLIKQVNPQNIEGS